MIDVMVKENWYIVIKKSIRENGKMIKEMEKESLILQMETFMR